MKHIKTIETLYNKAMTKYEKNKLALTDVGAVGVAKINGTMWGSTYRQERYKIEVSDNYITLSHWGTQTLKIRKSDNEIVEYYGESNSDRDSMNTLLNLVDIYNVYFRYFPSKHEFIKEVR